MGPQKKVTGVRGFTKEENEKIKNFKKVFFFNFRKYRQNGKMCKGFSYGARFFTFLILRLGLFGCCI